MRAGTQRGLAPVKFLIDASVSRFAVKAFATGLLSALGHNPTIGLRDYEGKIQFDPPGYENAVLRVMVQLSSLDVQDEMKRDDRTKLERLMYGETLDVSHFPAAVYESTHIIVETLSSGQLYAHVVGDLSFHGVTKRHALGARVSKMGTMLRISGEFPLLLSDYGIKPVSFAAGALRLKDEVKFSFELVAREQE